MSKTPYEIRFDLLQLAQNILTSQYYASLEAVQRQVELNTKFNQNVTEALEAFAEANAKLKFPTMNDIIEKANELNDFISKQVDKK